MIKEKRYFIERIFENDTWVVDLDLVCYKDERNS